MFNMYCTEDMDYTIGGYYIFNVRPLLSLIQGMDLGSKPLLFRYLDPLGYLNPISPTRFNPSTDPLKPSHVPGRNSY